jgi:hypothetical protein
MSAFASLTSSDESIENETDVVRKSFGPIAGGIYPSTITMAYASKSRGGAQALTLHLETDSGHEYKQDIYATSGTAKGCLNTYVDKNTGKKEYLPGFLLIESLCLLAVGKPVSELSAEDKLVNIWSYDAKKEVPTEVPVLTELLGKRIEAGILKVFNNKNVNQGTQEAPNWVKSNEVEEKNEIDKFFRATDHMTTAEIRGGSEASYWTKWPERNTYTPTNPDGTKGEKLLCTKYAFKVNKDYKEPGMSAASASVAAQVASPVSTMFATP